MIERHNSARGASEWADTYGQLGMASPMQLTQLPLHILDPWVDPDGKPQPFKPYSQEKLNEMAESIRKNGVIEAICVRPMPNGRFQIIAGHNRVAASKLAGLATIPAVVRQMDDNEAAILMVDSNLEHREKLFYSEKAFAYKKRLEAMNRQGLRTDLTSTPVVSKSGEGTNSTCAPMGHKSDEDTNSTCAPMGHKLVAPKSRDILAAEKGESREQIRRYIRLTELVPLLLDLVDDGKFSFRAAVEVSYLQEQEQQLLSDHIAAGHCKAPSMAQAAELRELSQQEALNEASLLSVMVKAPAPKTKALKLPGGRISSFFPQNTTPAQMEDEICEALAFYRAHKTPASD